MHQCLYGLVINYVHGFGVELISAPRILVAQHELLESLVLGQRIERTQHASTPTTTLAALAALAALVALFAAQWYAVPM